MRVKFSFKEDGEFFELEEGLCGCEPSPLPHLTRPISEITIDTPPDGPPWAPDFIFVQIESGPKHSSDFSVPTCKKCHKLMVSQERLERNRKDPDDRVFSNPPQKRRAS